MAPTAAIATPDIVEKARRDLLQLLEGVRGKKNLVLEKELAGTLNLIVKFSTLQEYGVSKLFFLENDNVDSSQRNVIFLARGEKAKTVFSIAEQIKRLGRNGQVDHEFCVFWAPRRTLVSDQILEEQGVLGEISVFEYPLYFIPLADDVLSLELEDGFGDLYLKKDPTPIFLAAKALMLIQKKHGLFPRMLGKGDNAKRLADLLVRMRNELSAGEESSNSSSSFLGLTPSSSIESLIIIDREVDLPSVLLTQLTYEGLIDELFTIKSNQTEVDSSIIGAAAAIPPNQGGPAPGSASQLLKRSVRLEQKDTLYSTLCDTNFAVVGSLLNKVARRLQSSYENRNIAGKTTAELRDFIGKLPGYQAEHASLKLHTSLAEEIIKHTRSDIFTRILEVQQNLAAGADPSTQNDNIEELIARDIPVTQILRLLCLYSTISNGLRARDYENFSRAFLHGYGHQHLTTLSSLSKMGLFDIRASTGGALGVPIPGRHHSGNALQSTYYPSVRKSLNLIVDDVNEAEPNDIAYVFSGYAPLSVRLVQCAVQKHTILSPLNVSNAGKQATGGGGDQTSTTASIAQSYTGWRPFDDILRHIRGPTVDITQSHESEKAVRARQVLNGSGSGADAKEKTVVVFFLGGVCRAEIAALRFVQTQLREQAEKDGRKAKRLLIATTEIISGDRVVEVAMEREKFGAPPAAAATTTAGPAADE